MLRQRPVQIAGVILLLVIANILNYFYQNWGLITVKVTDAPLGKVLHSIEWQGWVTIYTNLPADTKVSMYVDHVPLAEAMETLAANVTGPAPTGDRPPRENRPPGADGAGVPPNGAPPGGNPTAGDRPPRGDRPPGGRGGFGGGGGAAQWNLAFFVAPTSAEVKKEIQDFQAGTTDDDSKVYNYATPMIMIASDEEMPAADPRRQSWPGYKPPAPPAPAPPAADGSPAPTPDPAAAATPAAEETPTVQTYLKAFAQSANIWIMAPGSWATASPKAPPAHSSIISAIKNFVGSSHGSVKTAIILRSGRGGRGSGGGGFPGFADMETTADRMQNAINGLPEDARPAAQEQLNQEVAFFQSVKAAPLEEKFAMIRKHLTDKMANRDNWRRSPEGRAKMYQHMVSNRETAQGKK